MALNTSNISANTLANSYTLFNATNIKQFIISQLQSGENPVFKDADRLGANVNALIDVFAVILQQILFNYNLNTSETGFNTAVLYESMNKIVSILNYKTAGKQTSMLPVRLQIQIPPTIDLIDKKQFTVPKFLTIHYNSSYILRSEIVSPIDKNTTELWIDTVLFQGNLQESPIYTALGDEFELFTLVDKYINNSDHFISDNFFTIFVDEYNDGRWTEYKEVSNIFDAKETDKVYEKRFTEKFNYEFKFGNGINGRKLPTGARLVIYYLLSDGEPAQIGTDMATSLTPMLYSSALYTQIYNSIHSTNLADIDNVEYISIVNTGPSTDISYPESVASIRANAPKIFSSQNRLFSLADYQTYIQKNFTTFCKDVYMMKNDDYTGQFLKYYYELGVDAIQKDSRLALSQVEFMTSTNFNNVYAVVVPKVNTIISDKVPNYLNTTIKQEIVESTKPYQGLTHNLVLIDPIYKACTFGSFALDDDEFNDKQLQNTLVLVRNRLTKYSYTFIKDYCNQIFINYFDSMLLGSGIDTASLSQQIASIPGVKDFFIRDINDHVEDKLTWYIWNPLYPTEDNYITQQNYITEPFVYCYFYNLKRLTDLIVIEED